MRRRYSNLIDREAAAGSGPHLPALCLGISLDRIAIPLSPTPPNALPCVPALATRQAHRGRHIRLHCISFPPPAHDRVGNGCLSTPQLTTRGPSEVPSHLVPKIECALGACGVRLCIQLHLRRPEALPRVWHASMWRVWNATASRGSVKTAFKHSCSPG